MIDPTKVTNIKMDSDPAQYPEFEDAFIESCDYDGKPATEEQLEQINEVMDLCSLACESYF